MAKHLPENSIFSITKAKKRLEFLNTAKGRKKVEEFSMFLKRDR